VLLGERRPETREIAIEAPVPAGADVVDRAIAVAAIVNGSAVE
jgi:hypothetical protein